MLDIFDCQLLFLNKLITGIQQEFNEMSKQTLKKSCLQSIMSKLADRTRASSPPVVRDDGDVREVDLER